jgi:hypothetical protein
VVVAGPLVVVVAGPLVGAAVVGGVVVAGALVAGVVVGALVGAAVVEGAAVVVGWSAPGVPALVVGCATPAWRSAAMAAVGTAHPSSTAITKAANSRRGSKALLTGPVSGEQRQSNTWSVLTIRATGQTPNPLTLRARPDGSIAWRPDPTRLVSCPLPWVVGRDAARRAPDVWDSPRWRWQTRCGRT